MADSDKQKLIETVPDYKLKLKAERSDKRLEALLLASASIVWTNPRANLSRSSPIGKSIPDKAGMAIGGQDGSQACTQRTGLLSLPIGKVRSPLALHA